MLLTVKQTDRQTDRHRWKHNRLFGSKYYQCQTVSIQCRKELRTYLLTYSSL